MKFLTIVIFLLVQINLFSQNYFSIRGHITYNEKDVNITDCRVKLISSSAVIRETKSDSIGNFRIDSIPRQKDSYEFTVSKRGFFDSKKKLIFFELPHDTIMNFEMVFMVIDYYWLPDIHFHKNSSRPERNFKDTLSYIQTFLETTPPSIKIKIIGHKDCSETKDKRKERVQVIYNELIKLGVSKEKLITEISDLPSFYYTCEKDYNTAERKYQAYSEDYISTFSKGKQKKIRQLNECVGFEISMD